MWDQAHMEKSGVDPICFFFLSPHLWVLSSVFRAGSTYRIDPETVHRKGFLISSTIQSIRDRLQSSLDLGLFGCSPLKVGFKESQLKACLQTRTHKHVHTHTCTHTQTYTPIYTCMHTETQKYRHICTYWHKQHTGMIFTDIGTYINTHINIDTIIWHMYTTTCVYTHICIHWHTHKHIHAHRDKHTYLYTLTHKHTPHIPTRAHIFTQTHIHTRTHGHTHVHTACCF